MLTTWKPKSQQASKHININIKTEALKTYIDKQQ
jgi:hypothetical protein